jgi:uncharacterized protein (TIGR03437 family)
MPSLPRRFCLAAPLLLPFLLHSQQELRIQSDRAPAGGRALIRIGLTEPDPILTGKFAFSYSGGPLQQIRGLGLFSDQYDVVGAARISGSTISVRFASFQARAGATNELPVAVIAVDVDPAARAGQAAQLTINPTTTQLVAPNGQPYVTAIKPADFAVGGLSVTSSEPSSGLIALGQTITLRGVGFDADVEVAIENVAVTSVQLVSPTEIRLVAGQPFRIEGKRIRVRNKRTNDQQFFYAFTPATPIPTTQNAYLATLVPVFNSTLLSRGLLRSVTSGGANLTALALSNPGPTPSQINVEVRNAALTVVGTHTFSLPAGAKSLQEVSELVPQAAGLTGGYLVVRASLPVGMLGLRGTNTEDTLTPVILEDDPLPGVTPTPAPAIRPGGISLSTHASPTLSARALFSLYGSQFAPAGAAVSASAADITNGLAPGLLAGVCVFVNGQRAPLSFVSAGQINGQVPSLTALGPVSFVVARNCGTATESRSEPQTATLDPVSPGLFVLNQQSGAALLPVAALLGGGPTVAADPAEIPGAAPARPGEFISLFGTGFGPVRGGLLAGQIPERLGLDVNTLRLTNALTVSIGGIAVPPEDLFYAGAAPCCAGLDQLVVRVPPALTTGKWEVSVSILGRSTARGPYLSVLR